MIRYQGQWVQEQIGPKTNYYGPPGVGNYQRQAPNAVDPRVTQQGGKRVMDGPGSGFNYPGTMQPAVTPRPVNAVDPRIAPQSGGRVMDGPGSGFNYPGTGGGFPPPSGGPPPGMDYARAAPQDNQRVLPPPMRPGMAQPIQPQSQGTPYGTQQTGLAWDMGDDIRRAPPGQPTSQPGTSWQPAPADYRRSVVEDQRRAAAQDRELAERRQNAQASRGGGSYGSAPARPQAYPQDEENERLLQAMRDRGEAVAADSRLDGPITAADEKATVGTGQNRQTVADLKRQRQRSQRQRQEEEMARQQAQAEYEGIRSEFPGVSDDTLHHIVKKRNQERIAAGRAAAEKELGLGPSAPPRPAGGFAAMPNAGMRPNVDPGFNAMRNFMPRAF